MERKAAYCVRMAAAILAAADPLHLDDAPVRFAAALAARTGAPLMVAAVAAANGGVGVLAGGQSGEDLARDAGEALAQATRAASEEGVEAEPVEVAAASAPRGLALTAQEVGAGLLVVGSGGGGRHGHVRRGPTGDRLLNGAPCPVALVPRDWAPRFDTIGAAFVDTAEGRAAVRGAHALAARSGARLRVLAAVRPRPWMEPDAREELRWRIESAAQAAVSGLVGAPVDVDVSATDPGDLLAGVSSELDLLVCGTRGYGPRPGALLGGVTTWLTSEAACPVIVLAGDDRLEQLTQASSTSET